MTNIDQTVSAARFQNKNNYNIRHKLYVTECICLSMCELKVNEYRIWKMNNRSEVSKWKGGWQKISAPLFKNSNS
jgi:hypothetical protein